MLPFIVKNVLLSWHGSFVGRIRKKVWYVAFVCLLWMVWREQNKRAFENKKVVVRRIKLHFLYNLWAWSLFFFDE